MENKVVAGKAFFIKLGEGGSWDLDCIENSRLDLGYLDVDHDLCSKGKWEDLRNTFPYGADAGAKTRHLNQVRIFYEEPKSTLWITFYSDRLWWCFADTEIIYNNENGSKSRGVIGKWQDKDINGRLLTKGRLSGKLLSVQSFRGTICSVKEREYLLHKINGTNEPHVEEAEEAVDDLINKLVPIIKNLHPKDFEIFTDLIFRQSGWQRSGVAGEVEKDIDLALVSPITQEYIAVQIKSNSSKNIYLAYKEKYSHMEGFSKFYFVTHSPNQDLLSENRKNSDPDFILWDEKELSSQAVRNGLVGWLLDRAT